MSVRRISIVTFICLVIFAAGVIGAGVGYLHGFQHGRYHWGEDEVDPWMSLTEQRNGLN